MKYVARVKYNGNHYYAGEAVIGSKVEHRSNGEVWLFDDEPINCFPFYGDSREEWVEIDVNTLREIGE